MCGRYEISLGAREIEKVFKVKLREPFLVPRYNAAPTETLPVVLNTDPYYAGLIPWGFKFSWMSRPLINIRKETLAEKKTFQKDLETRRCLVLANSFYEWRKEGKISLPFRFFLKSQKPFAMAGLWQKNEAGKLGFAIITVAANPLVGKIHHRMPAILIKSDEGKWLSADIDSKNALQLLQSYPANLMTFYQVSTMLNRGSIDNDILIKRVKAQGQ